MRGSLAVAAALALAGCATVGNPKTGPDKLPRRAFYASVTLVEKGGTCVLGDKTADIRAHTGQMVIWQVYSDCSSSRWLRFDNWTSSANNNAACISQREVNQEIQAGSYELIRRIATGPRRTVCTFDVKVCADASPDKCTKHDPRILIEN